jgi:hypothetical protein
LDFRILDAGWRPKGRVESRRVRMGWKNRAAAAADRGTTGDVGTIGSDSTRATRPMNTTPPAIQALARRLIALEAARDPSDGPAGATIRTCAKLRSPLVKLVGASGFRSLLSRALAMAKAEVPALDVVQVRTDGFLEGLDGIESPQESEPGVIVARLLNLLATFIGEPLTLGLVRDAWPDASATGIDAGIEEES